MPANIAFHSALTRYKEPVAIHATGQFWKRSGHQRGLAHRAGEAGQVERFFYRVNDSVHRAGGV